MLVTCSLGSLGKGRKRRAPGNPRSQKAGGRRSRDRLDRPGKPGPSTGLSPPSRRGSGLAPLVLIVDDVQDSRDMFSGILEYSGYLTVNARCGLEAIEKAVDLLPTVILMDLAMPGLNGWEATRFLRQNPRTRRIPIIAVTGHALPENERRAREAGCDSFLIKPVHPMELLTELRKVLERPRVR